MWWFMALTLMLLLALVIWIVRFIIMDRSATVHDLAKIYVPKSWQNYGIIWSNELITLTHRIIAQPDSSIHRTSREHFGLGSFTIVEVDINDDNGEPGYELERVSQHASQSVSLSPSPSKMSYVIIQCHLTKKQFSSPLAARSRNYKFYDLSGKTYHHTHYPGTAIAFRRGPAKVTHESRVMQTQQHNETVAGHQKSLSRRRRQATIKKEDLGEHFYWNFDNNGKK